MKKFYFNKNILTKIHKISNSINSTFSKLFHFWITHNTKLNKISNSINSTFSKLFHFSIPRNTKLNKISNFNKYLIFTILSLFIYLFYLSIPSLYNKGKLQKDLTSKLLTEFNINVSFSANLNYSILPSPQIIIKDAKIFNNNKENPKELVQIKKMRIIISQRKLFNQDKIKIKKIIIQDANFLIQKSDINFYTDFINNKFSSKAIDIRNSNIFYKNLDNETISIFLIDKSRLFYDLKKFSNQLFINGKVFKIPFTIDFNKIFTGDQPAETKISLKNLKFNFKNKSIKKNKINYGKNNFEIRNFKIYSKYKFENDSILFESLESKLKNNLLDYKGQLHFNPFHLKLDINLDKIDLKKLIISNSIIKELIKTNILYNSNISTNLTLDINKLIRNKLFDSSKLFFNINNGTINIDNSFLINNKIGTLKIYKSSLKSEANDTIFKSNFNFIISNKKEFFKTFQVPKKNRTDIKNIFFSVQYDFFKNQFKINNFSINEKNNPLNIVQQNILENFSPDEKNGIKNWIDLKRLVNQLLDS
jgi:hypothetical protein